MDIVDEAIIMNLANGAKIYFYVALEFYWRIFPLLKYQMCEFEILAEITTTATTLLSSCSFNICTAAW